MARRKTGGQAFPSAALPPPGDAPARLPARYVRVVFVRRHQHGGIWYEPGEGVLASPAELELLQTFAEVELP